MAEVEWIEKEDCLESPVRCLCHLYLKPLIEERKNHLRTYIDAEFERLKKNAEKGTITDNPEYYRSIHNVLKEIASLRELAGKLGCR